MKLEAILFDLDGTLLDTLNDLADSCNRALATQGLPALPVEEYKLHIGSGARHLIGASLARATTMNSGRPVTEMQFPPDEVDRLLAVYRNIYAENWSNKTVVYPGVAEMLRELRAEDVKLAVLSNKPDDFTRIMVQHYFPADTFDAVFGLSEKWPAKPVPDLALHICRQLDAGPENTALVGDSGSDMETARRAGMRGFGVLWGFRDKKELVEHGAQELFETVADLHGRLQIIRGSAPTMK